MERKGMPTKKNLEASNFHIRIDSPSYDDFNTSDFEEFIQRFIPQWRKNHQRLLKVIKSGNFPFFGLHGTTDVALRQIQNEKKGYFRVATFDKKDNSERFLYQLYDAVLYPTGYISSTKERHKSEGRGGIMVFNLEEREMNISFPSEHLASSSGREMSSSFTFDSKEEKEFFDWFWEGKDHLLYDGSLNCYPDEFEIRLKGIIGMNDLEKYLTLLKIKDINAFPRETIRSRFFAQEILARTLELLKTKPNVS